MAKRPTSRYNPGERVGKGVGIVGRQGNNRYRYASL
jgi:hypothetical protein